MVPIVIDVIVFLIVVIVIDMFISLFFLDFVVNNKDILFARPPKKPRSIDIVKDLTAFDTGT